MNLKSNHTIREALGCLNKAPFNPVLVTSEMNKLLGSITDGDVRRGLINGFSLDDSVSSIMNANPVVGLNVHSSFELKGIMELNALTSVPVVDERGYLIRVESIANKKDRAKHQNPVFIMAGGFGKRLLPLTETCPKPMLSLGGKPILHSIIDGFIEAGFSNFYISTHYLPDVIRDYFGDGQDLDVSITYVHEEVPMGTGGALALLPRGMVDLPVIMINGDIITKIDFEGLLNYHVNHGQSATMCVRKFNYQIPFGVIKGDVDGRVLSMVEKPTHESLVNAGIYVLAPSVVSSVTKGVPIDMPAVLESQIAMGQVVHMFPIHEYWLDVGRIADFEQAKGDYQKNGVNND